MHITKAGRVLGSLQGGRVNGKGFSRDVGKIICLASFVISVSSVEARQVFTQDIEIQDVTPGIIFNDTSVADVQEEWFIRGRDEYFSIVDVVDNTDVLFFDQQRMSVSVGYFASAANSNSTALGSAASASGFNSTALGYFASATGFRSAAMGLGASAIAEDAIALGRDASATGSRSAVLGTLASAEGLDSIALGYSANVVGNSSSALGSLASATGLQSVALGNSSFTGATAASAVGGFASATGSNSAALGYAASASGNFSTALGARADAAGERSIALGYLASAPNPNTIVLGAIPGINDPANDNDYASLANGTTNPLAPLHIFRDDATQEFLFLESNEAVVQDRAMMYLVNNGGIRFQFENTVLQTAWRFQAATGNQDSFEIARVGTGEIEFRVDADGNAYVAGLIFENSDRNTKIDIVPVDPEQVLEKVTQLPIAEWAYRESPESRHIGPMAQDFHAAFSTGDSDRRLATMDVSGVAIASIQALNARLERENGSLKQKNAELEERLELVEALVTQILPKTAQN